MKSAAKKELQTKTIEELIKDLRDLRSEVAKLSVEMVTGKITNVNLMRGKKKDIARILTFISQKNTASANVGKAKKEV